MGVIGWWLRGLLPGLGALAVASAVVRQVLAAVGIAGMVAPMFMLEPSSRFPGWWALPPVLGAALVIAVGSQTWINARLLAWRPVVWLGLISYPLYLWHWPLLTFARLFSVGKPTKALLLSRSPPACFLTG